MMKISDLALLATLSFGAFTSSAQADSGLSGQWKLAVGSVGAPCDVTFAMGDASTAGTVSAATGCDGMAAQVAKWNIEGSQVAFKSNSGELLALLRANGDSYSGKSLADSRKIVLSHAVIGQK